MHCSDCITSQHGVWFCASHARMTGLMTIVQAVNGDERITLLVCDGQKARVCTDCKAWLTSNGMDLATCKAHGWAKFSFVDAVVTDGWETHGPSVQSIVDEGRRRDG